MCCFAIECVQCIVYFLNIILILTGVGLLISSIILLINGFAGSMSILVPGMPYFYVAILLLIAAIFILCVGCYGCMAAYKGDVCALIWYYVLVVIVICLEASTLMMTFAHWRSGYHPAVREYVTSRALVSLKRYGMEGETKFTNAWDKMQIDQECCGVSSHNDWYEYHEYETNRPPDTCCTIFYEGCSKAIDGAELWDKGCDDFLVNETFRGLGFMGSVVFIFIIIQIILLIFVAILIFLHKFGNDPKNTCCGTYVKAEASV